MNAVELKKSILTGKFTLREKLNGKSPIWTIFREIVNESGVKVPYWVACHYCRNVYCYDNRKLGTSNLLKHKCGKGRVQPRSSIDLQDRILQGCLRFVSKDLRPFDVVSGTGFKELAEIFLRAGSNLKTPSELSDIVPHQDKFSPHLEIFTQRCREQLTSEIVERVCSTGGGIILDTWEWGKDTYLSVSLHYVKNFSVAARFLSITRLDPELMMSGDYLKIQTMQERSNYAISEWLPNFVYVCTRGSFIQAALKNVCKINCASTPIVNALNHAISSNQSELTMLKTCRDVLTYFSSLDSNEEFRVSSVQEAENQWEIALSTCETVVKNLGAIRERLIGSRWENVIDHVVEKDVKDFVECLNPFQLALSEMNGEKYPTIYLVYLWHFKILDHLQDRSGDSQLISLFKASVKHRYLGEVEIDIVHKVAVFLHPLLKNLRMIVHESEKLEIYQWVRYRLDEIKKTMGRDNTAKSPERPSENSSRLSEALIHFMDAETVTNAREEDELGIYKRMKLSEVVINGFDLLDWWERQKIHLPNLCVLANRIFAVPATSAHFFHCFSLPRKVVLERMSQLEPSYMEDILFSNCHYKYKT